MISSENEYRKALEELVHLRSWLARLGNDVGTERKGFTVASVQRMMSRLRREVADYESAKAGDAGIDRRAESQN